MTIYDITVPVSNSTVVYPGDPAIEINAQSCMSSGDSSNVSMVSLGTHTGTHIDPPYHMMENGANLDQVSLESLVGSCYVCHCKDAMVIEVEDLEGAGIPEGTSRVLFRTRNSEFWSEPQFRPDFTYIDPQAAAWLINRGVKLVGIDYLSVDEPNSDTHPTHMKLIGAGVLILEGLDLRKVTKGIYTLVCLPLKIAGGDGGPARAILISNSDFR